MELIYSKNVMERALEAITEAKRLGKVVERVVLNDQEIADLSRIPLGATKDDPFGQLSTKSVPEKDEPHKISGVPVYDEFSRPVF